MSDDIDSGGDEGAAERSEARKQMIEAIGKHADSWPDRRGSVVTGYIVLYELTDIEGNKDLLWACGDGMNPEDDEVRWGGLPSWRVEGMLHYAIRMICGGSVRHTE